MRKRYLTGYVKAIRQTALAVCITFDWSDDHGYAPVADLWVPLSVISDDDHSEIEDACAGDLIEISIAEWWMQANMESA